MTARSWKISSPAPTCPCGTVGLDAVGEQLEDDRGRAQRDQKAGEEAARHSTPNRTSSAIMPSDAHHHLQSAAAEDQALDAASFSRLNSMPMVKSRNITPTSAAASTSA